MNKNKLLESIIKDCLYEAKKMTIEDKIQKIILSDDFKSWFDGSKVIDDDGNPLMVYHGGRTDGIKKFNSNFDGIWFSDNIKTAEAITSVVGLDKPKHSKKIKDILHGEYNSTNELYDELRKNGFKITRDMEYGKYGEKKWVINVIDNNGHKYVLNDYERATMVKHYIMRRGKNYAVFLKIINPFIIDAKSSNWDDIPFNGGKTSTMNISLYAKENGHDGVIFKNLYEIGVKSDFYVVYDGGQVKMIN